CGLHRAMQPTVSPAVAANDLRGHLAPKGTAIMSFVELAVASIGHRVPRTGFVFKVHSVFARACNFACDDDALLSLVAPSAGNAPRRLVLGGDPIDCGTLFGGGEVIDGGAGPPGARRAAIQWRDAAIWRPPARRAFADGKRIAGHLQIAAARLARHR